MLKPMEVGGLDKLVIQNVIREDTFDPTRAMMQPNKQEKRRIQPLTMNFKIVKANLVLIEADY